MLVSEMTVQLLQTFALRWLTILTSPNCTGPGNPVHLGQRPDWLSHIPWSDMAPVVTDCGGWGWHDVRTAPSHAGISEDIVLFVHLAAFVTYADRHIVTIRYDS